MSVLDTLRAATPARKSVTMCVDGALQAEWDALKDSLDEAARRDDETRSMADLPETTKVVEAMEAIRGKVQASEVTFLFEKMDWEAKIVLQAAHPPRDQNLADRIHGFNIATFYPALVKGSCVSVTGADGDEVTDIPDDVWEALLGAPADGETPARAGSLNLRQVDTLTGAANAVNDRSTSVPPSARSLLGSQDSGASLAQPSPGMSPPDVSTDGNPSGLSTLSESPTSSTPGAVSAPEVPSPA